MAGESFSVLVFNAWGGGLNEGKPIDETLAVLKAANADIIALNEVRAESPDCAEQYCPPARESIAPALAGALGYHFVEQQGMRASPGPARF